MNSIYTSKTHTALPLSASAGLLKGRYIFLSSVAKQINHTSLVHFAWTIRDKIDKDYLIFKNFKSATTLFGNIWVTNVDF